MNAIDFLIKEHDKVRQTLSRIQDQSKFETKSEMFDVLCQDLVRHETMEQKVWYPHFKHSEKIEDEVKHLLKEEEDAKKAINDFQKDMDEKEWEKKFNKFKKDVEHHAHEEESKLFPNVKKILNESQLEKIGKEMQDYKDHFEKK